MNFEEKDFHLVEPETELDIYKALVVKRDRLRKEEKWAYIEYVKTFGSLIEQRFSLQIECIKIKKIIALYWSKKNRGESIPSYDAMAKNIEHELEEYYADLNSVREIVNSKSKPISEYESMIIKKKYKLIAMSIHPDLHPDFQNNPELMDIWEKVKVAYKANDLEALEEAEVLVAAFLEKHQIEMSIDASDLERKISKLNIEIAMIMANNPYRYKYILNDSLSIKSKNEELNADIAEYQGYLNELQKKLDSLRIKKD